MPRRVLLAVFTLAFFQISDTASQEPDLQALLDDDRAREAFLIAYWPPANKGWVQSFFVYGNGSVILQAVPDRPMATTDVPTCAGQIDTKQVKHLTKLLIEKRFLELPERHFIFIYAAQTPDELQIHSIGISDGHAKIRRSFGVGKFAGKDEVIPDEFAAIEDSLKATWHKEFPPNDKECHFAPAIVF